MFIFKDVICFTIFKSEMNKIRHSFVNILHVNGSEHALEPYVKVDVFFHRCVKPYLIPSRKVPNSTWGGKKQLFSHFLGRQ